MFGARSLLCGAVALVLFEFTASASECWPLESLISIPGLTYVSVDYNSHTESWFLLWIEGGHEYTMPVFDGLIDSSARSKSTTATNPPPIALYWHARSRDKGDGSGLKLVRIPSDPGDPIMEFDFEEKYTTTFLGNSIRETVQGEFYSRRTCALERTPLVKTKNDSGCEKCGGGDCVYDPILDNTFKFVRPHTAYKWLTPRYSYGCNVVQELRGILYHVNLIKVWTFYDSLTEPSNPYMCFYVRGVSVLIFKQEWELNSKSCGIIQWPMLSNTNRPTTTTTIVKPVPTTTTIELAPLITLMGPVSATSIIELDPTTSTVDFDTNTSTIELDPTTSTVEPVLLVESPSTEAETASCSSSKLLSTSAVRNETNSSITGSSALEKGRVGSYMTAVIYCVICAFVVAIMAVVLYWICFAPETPDGIEGKTVESVMTQPTTNTVAADGKLVSDAQKKDYTIKIKV